jgi:hypothetical protein
MKALYQIFILAAVTVFSGSCKKPEQLGPDIKGVYGPVNVTQPLAKSNGNPDFSTGETVYFNAAFENDAIWTLTIVGQTSGAVKTITGISSQLGAYNATWDGTADDAPSFLLENVTITLSFQNSPITFTETLTIAGRKNLDAGGVLVADFSVNKSYCVCGPPNPNGWPSDWPATGTAVTYGIPDGNAYMSMSGTPWQGTPVTPYVDFMTIEAKNAQVNYGDYFPLYADPAKVYFNIMVYNTGTADTWLKVMIIEEGGVVRELDIRPDWTGWKLISKNYTELTTTSTAAGKPNKVTTVQFVLLSDANPLPGAAVSTAFDHVIFTHNKPYQP